MNEKNNDEDRRSNIKFMEYKKMIEEQQEWPRLMEPLSVGGNEDTYIYVGDA